MHNLNVEFGDLSDTLPPRSVLYSLPIIGVGTAEQESLLGYMSRLARAHRVSVFDLLTMVVLPSAEIGEKWTAGNYPRHFPRTANGYNLFAIEFANTLSRLTQVRNLHCGTFQRWQPLFDPSGSGLLHKTKHWCPECVADDLSAGREPNFKLLWSSVCVTHCHQHGVALVDRCKSCHADLRVLSETSAFGRCSDCGLSLGWSVGSSKANRMKIGSRERFKSHSVGEMVAFSDGLIDLVQPQLLSSRLASIVESIFGGSVNRMATCIGIGHMPLSRWINQSARPRFGALVEVCYRLGVTPIQLLTSHKTENQLAITHDAAALRKPSKKLTALQLEAIEHEIFELVEQGTCSYRTMREFAARHNVSTAYLARRIPAANAQLAHLLRELRAQRAALRLATREVDARKVAVAFYRAQRPFKETEIYAALRDQGLFLGCPMTRRAFHEEWMRLQREQP